jgi:RHS repeat-associated protein
LLADALGSTIGLVSANNGPIATSYTYQPFGKTTVSGASNGNVYEFTGRENDGTPGALYYYRARYYNPNNQRFVAQDPMDFSGGEADLYAYVGERPLLYKDPSGLSLIPPHPPGCVPGLPCPIFQGGASWKIIRSNQ